MRKMKALLKSRKFWTTIAAIATVVGGVMEDKITSGHAINLIVAALAAYCLGTALETPQGGQDVVPTPSTPSG